MAARMRLHEMLGLGLAVASLTACPSKDEPAAGGTDTTDGATPSSTGDTSTGSTSGSTSTGFGSTDDDTTGGGFIEQPDGGASNLQCDPWSQDCDEGQKCSPFANNGATEWNATKCVPLEAATVGPGDACTMDGGAAAARDNCDNASMCLDFGPRSETMGVCLPFCTGTPEEPACEDPERECTNAINGGALPLCLPSCDPVAQECPSGTGCYSSLTSFVCIPERAEGKGNYGDPCEFLNGCLPGLYCAPAAAVPGCTTTDCCTNFCDLKADDPDAACKGEGQTCQSAYSDTPPPGREHVGLCQTTPA